MKTHSNLASRIFGIIAIAAVAWLQPTAVSGQTAEGTEIDNVATVIYTDANSNVYSPVISSMVRVTVGFSGALNVDRAQATVTPASPSTLNILSFDVNNIGNGSDTVSVSGVISDGTVITAITEYTLDTTPYATLPLLNAALATTEITAGSGVTITVEYTVALGKAGQPSTYTLTATSQRLGAATDNDNTVVTPGWTGTVETTPLVQAITQLPSTGSVPTYTFTFNVANDQNGTDDFTLDVTLSGGGVITILSVDGVGGASTTITNLAAGANQDIDVVYSVAIGAAAGATETLFLDATSVATSETDQGSIDLTVIKANLAITKEAWQGDQLAEISGDVFPGDFIEYKVIVTNNGTADAASVHVDDLLPSDVAWVSTTGDLAGWSFSESSGDVDADLSGVLAPAASRYFWIRVRVN